MNNTNTIEELKQDLAKLLKESIVSILFKKKDGTERNLLCTLKPDLLPSVEQKETDEPKKEKKKSDTNLAVWDLEKNAWRSFRLDSVISYKVTN